MSFSLPGFAQQDFYGFTEVLTGRVAARANTDIQATVLEANLKGGVIQVRMPDTAGNTFGDYEFRWEFLDDISKIEPGKEYRFTMAGKRVGGTSERNTNTAWMRSANSGSDLAEAMGIKNPGNTIVTAANFGAVTGYPVRDNNNATGVLRSASTNVADSSYFTFRFDFSSVPYSSTSLSCSFEVAYLYRKNHVATTPMGKPNCPNLYHLGVNIGILEYGTLTDANSTFMIGFIDQALIHAKAANCIPTTDIAALTDIKKRMGETETSGTFAAEVSNFRQHLARVVQEACVCDHGDKATGTSSGGHGATPHH